MKRLINSIVIVCLLISAGCTGFEEDFEEDGLDGLVDNSENIQKMIKSFDETLTLFLEADLALSEGELGDFFINEAKSAGLEIITSKNQYPYAGLAMREENYSDAFYAYSSLITSPTSFNSSRGYSVSLNTAISEVRRANMPYYEKQILVDNMMFMDSFVDWMGYRNNLNLNQETIVTLGCEGWWACWGRCVAGTAGRAVSGAVIGCAGVGIVGATIGAVGGIKGAAVGAIVGCAAGGILNGVGNGLEGYAMYCD